MDYIYEDGKIYSTDADGKELARVLFPAVNGRRIITHVYVDESLRGQGIASELMKLALEEIRKEKSEFSATCPYAVKWLQKNKIEY